MCYGLTSCRVLDWNATFLAMLLVNIKVWSFELPHYRDHRVVWIKKMQTAGFYNPKTGEAVTFKGERNGATDMLVILHCMYDDI